MSPDIILSRLESYYASLHSYQDTGVVLVKLPGSSHIDETQFTTYFVRGGGFRFDWITHHPYPPLRHITTAHRIWANQKGIFSYWQGKDEIEVIETLELAIAGATGVSSMAAYTVPRMLLGWPDGFRLSHLGKPLASEGEIEGVPCSILSGLGWNSRPMQIEMTRDSLLLRRVSMSLVEDSSSEEIRRNIQVNHVIDDVVFDEPFPIR